jgi:hypothetical protein
MKCCHGTEGCEDQGDKHWCRDWEPKTPDGKEIRAFIGQLGNRSWLETAESVGGFRCRKKLSSGAVVTFSYVEAKPKTLKAPRVGVEVVVPPETDDEMTDEEAKALLAKLEKHFREPVMPVRQYCAALNLWASAQRDKATRLAEIENPGPYEIESAKDAARFANEVGHVFLQIEKSNLLHRLIYQRESLRTEACPVHKGKWSGCVWDDKPCGCQGVQAGGFGSNVTGWLP